MEPICTYQISNLPIVNQGKLDVGEEMGEGEGWVKSSWIDTLVISMEKQAAVK